MKATQFDYHNHMGVCTVLNAETDGEKLLIKQLEELIKGNEGIFSRKCFSFEDGELILEINRK